MEVIYDWMFLRECAMPDDIASDYTKGEQSHIAYKTDNGFAVITNKRIIIREEEHTNLSECVTCSSLPRVYSLPWSSIGMWSSVDSCGIRASTSIELLTHMGRITLNLERGVDGHKLNRLISECVLVQNPFTH